MLPIYVLEEIDTFKKELSERGRNAREVSRLLDDLREKGSLAHGIATEGGGKIRVALDGHPPGPGIREGNRGLADKLILGVALSVRDADPDIRTVLVTKDVNLRVRADANQVFTEDYDAERIDIDELYEGGTELAVGRRPHRKLLPERRGRASRRRDRIAQSQRVRAPSQRVLGGADGSGPLGLRPAGARGAVQAARRCVGHPAA